MNNKKIYVMLIAGMTVFSLFAIIDFGTVKAQSLGLMAPVLPAVKILDVRGLDYEDIGFSNGTHSWTGGLEPWLQAANGTYVPYIMSSNSTHAFFDSKQYPFVINKNTCIVTVYDISAKIAQNPAVVIGKDYWNYGYKTPTSPTYTIVDTSSLACTFTQTTNSSGYFAQAIKSDSDVQLSVTYSKKINQPFETFVTLTNLNPALNGDNFEPVEQMSQINLNALSTHVTTTNPELPTNLPDGTIKTPFDTLVKPDIAFKNKVNNIFQLDLSKTTKYFSQMTGTKSLGVASTTFEFGRNQSALSFGQRTTLDPTYGYTTVASKRVFNSVGLDSVSCPSTADASDNFAYLRLDPTGAGYTCTLLSYRWDISSIPSSAIINSANLQITVTSVSNPNNCDWVQMAHDPNTAAVNTIYNDIRTGTRWFTNDATCTTVQTNKVMGLSNAGVADIQNHLTAGWWSTGIDENPETRNTVSHQIVFGGNTGDANVALQITYNATPTVPAQVSSPTVTANAGNTETVTWTAPGNGGSAITGYEIDSSTNGGSTWSIQSANTGSTSTTYTSSALVSGTAYNWRVEAINAVGTGPAGVQSSAVVAGNVSTGNLFIGGNIYSTNSTGPFKITAPSGVAICIGTGC